MELLAIYASESNFQHDHSGFANSTHPDLSTSNGASCTHARVASMHATRVPPPTPDPRDPRPRVGSATYCVPVKQWATG